MQEFQQLLEIIDTLLGPNGCPWDREQTMKSIRSDLIEESCELVDAIDSDDNHHIQEELGDALFVVVFLSKLAEKEKRSHIKDVLAELNTKLIRRHPHVFGEAKIKTIDELTTQWNSIKSSEKGKTHRKSALDSIPKGLPALARAKKVSKKIKDTNFKDVPKVQSLPEFADERELGKILYAMVEKANAQGLDAEHALRQALVSVETNFREFETNSSSQLL